MGRNLDYVRSFVCSFSGIPVLSEVSQEARAFDYALRVALRAYWTASPYEYFETLVFKGSSSNVERDINDLLVKAFPNQSLREKAYYIGPVRISESDSVPLGNWDSWLLGLPRGSSYSSLVGGGRLHSSGFKWAMTNFDSVSLHSTILDMISGKLEYYIDPVKNMLYLIVPHGVNVLGIWHGFGLDDESLDTIPNRHITTFAKICAYHYLVTIVSARSSVQIESDFSIRTDFLESKISELKEELKEETSKFSFPLLWT